MSLRRKVRTACGDEGSKLRGIRDLTGGPGEERSRENTGINVRSIFQTEDKTF